MKKAEPARLGDTRGTAPFSRVLQGIKARFDRLFVHREILLRSSDRVRCLRLTPRFQKAACLLLAIGAGWAAYASVGFIEQRHQLADREHEIARSQAAYGDLLAEVDRYQRHFASITRELEATQQRLLSQLASEGVPEAADQRAERSDQTAEMKARMVVAQDELRGQLGALEVDLKDVARRNGSLKDRIHSLQSALTATENQRAEVEEAHHRLGRMLSETEMALAHERSEKADMASGMTDLKAQLADWKKRYAALSDAKDAVAQERDLLESDLASERATSASLDKQVSDLKVALSDARHGVKQAATTREELTGKLGSVRGELKQALGAREALEQKLAAAARQLSDSRSRIEALEQRREDLEKGSDRLARALRDSKSQNDALVERMAGLDQSLQLASDQIAGLKKERDGHLRQIADLAGNLDGSRKKVASLQGQLYGLTRTLDSADRKTEALAEQRDLLRARLTQAHTDLAAQAERHEAVIRRLSARTTQSIDTMEELLSLTGLNLDAVMDEANSKVEGDGKGGPFLPYVDTPDQPHAGHPAVTLGDLNDKIRHWEVLQQVLAATPFAAPLSTDFHISSYFGKRKDPINGRLSRHEGLDLVAAYRSPVLATAPGVVSFAGWLSGYGRVVEVDHGFGITTRYAHLRRIVVKVGERLGFHQEVGQLGNSGRSTGAHVHYEVRYNDKPLNPLKFMKAASHVLKG
ncbi:Murein DD-endopeptidase MepM and murein hydrolase activator NlpD, contain LysM domain [Tistlia consotensis]|uniref:Murein DD-endopeptidase MepM and murein hydrolase activator NlpD, contain LysM domain n=1 Tax=Tistlia consotensis USBA 355 TaxID=560819 RepID=A0A1Y6BLX0_9PROT|nr:peptidoglycan DD-metalloendopeptidase family protein [Tistlia consotensis]SMF18521.1 Murein DD-endopeptidase MepM and murein hydrolase activator NlpD, contain LysM domain [Tistlia consotensis USBA 355]SNR39645.1 Murein DD-endopeptidase MepM and murein hydrolase activator NlpD, contain LysM domain [Tistlia consotensis]